MPKEIKKHKTVLDAIRSVDIISELLEKHDGHFEHELDLEVIAYGRNYNGKKVGPYVHLYEYDSGEEVIREGDWGGNTFYITVAGKLDVFVQDRETGENRKVGELPAGASFGEMSILAGVPRNATICVPPDSKAQVLEVTRPALRLLRKLPKFGQVLDTNYRKHGLSRTLIDVKQATGEEFEHGLIERLGKSARFMVYAKHHVLFREGETIDRVIFIKNGWVRRVSGLGYGSVMGDLLIEGLPEGVGCSSALTSCRTRSSFPWAGNRGHRASNTSAASSGRRTGDPPEVNDGFGEGRYRPAGRDVWPKCRDAKSPTCSAA